MNDNRIAKFNHYLQSLSKIEYELLLEKAFNIAVHILKEKQLTT